MRPASLQINQLTLVRDKKLICQQLSYQFCPGRIIGLLGPNGCGKTTFLQALIGLYSNVKHCIMLNNQPLNLLHPKTIAQSIGLLFQELNYFLPQTVWDYCQIARFPHQTHHNLKSNQNESAINLALQQVELVEKKYSLISQLSGGELRRLAIAALYVQDPAIYLLDEPTNHLDIQHQMQQMSFFQRLARERLATIIFSTHDINLVEQFCDDVFLFFSGKMLYGKVSQLLTEENLQALYQYPIAALRYGNRTVWQPISPNIY